MGERSDHAESPGSPLVRRVAIGLGSNWESARQIVGEAVDALASQPGFVLKATSRLRQTRPIGGPQDQPLFVNAVALVETGLPPRRVLEILHQLEQQFGRQRGARWARRTLDLDILIDEAGPVCEPGLLIPHPRLAARRFFLEALGELYPQAWHFWSGMSVGRILSILREAPPWFVVVFETFPAENRIQDPVSAPGRRDILKHQRAHSIMAGLLAPEGGPAENERWKAAFSLPACDQEFDLAQRLGILPVEGSALLAWWQELEDKLAAGYSVVTGLPPLLPHGGLGPPGPQKLGEKGPREGTAVIHSPGPSEKPATARRGVRLHPRVVILGPLAARKEFWEPTATAPDKGSDPTGQLPFEGGASVHRAVLGQIRRIAPVVIVESDNPRDWPAHIAAAYEASMESGVVL